MIRFAVDADGAAIRALWERCFPDEGGFNDYFFSHFFDVRRVLLSEEGSNICAMVQMLPYSLRINGRERAVTYIYGACTDPTCRRQGHMARLLEHSFVQDRKVGRIASALIPAEKWLFDFYKPFGYQPFFFIKNETITAEKTGVPPHRLTKADIPQIQALYEEAAPACHMIRDSAYWQGQIDMFDALGKGVFGWFENGKLTAYAFCWEDSAQEAVGLTGERAQGLLNELGCRELAYTVCGGDTALGCIKWHETADCADGYMNLMFN